MILDRKIGPFDQRSAASWTPIGDSFFSSTASQWLHIRSIPPRSLDDAAANPTKAPLAGNGEKKDHLGEKQG
ncbi:MAG: hypothetical protein ABR907_14350 [Terracidiphilus sp.]|jgi:hypothetical protein